MTERLSRVVQRLAYSAHLTPRLLEWISRRLLLSLVYSTEKLTLWGPPLFTIAIQNPNQYRNPILGLGRSTLWLHPWWVPFMIVSSLLLIHSVVQLGAGYHMIMTKTSSCDVPALEDLLRKHVPCAKLESEYSKGWPVSGREAQERATTFFLYMASISWVADSPFVENVLKIWFCTGGSWVLFQQHSG